MNIFSARSLNFSALAADVRQRVTLDAFVAPFQDGAAATVCADREPGFLAPAAWGLETRSAEAVTFWLEASGRRSITFDGVRQFANFQLAHDPGRQVALAAGALLLLGLTTSLLVRQRRVFVRISGEAGSQTVEVAGLARTRRGLPEHELTGIASSLGLAGRRPADGDPSPTSHQSIDHPPGELRA